MKPAFKYILFLLFSAFLLSCGGSGEVAIPDDILSKEKMAEVMVDIHLLEATMNLNVGVTVDNAPNASEIFKKHDVTAEQYQQSFDFYTHNPELFGEVYQLVLNDLSKMQAEVANGK